MGKNREHEKINPLTPEERRRYAIAMRDLRAAQGMTDGLRVDRQTFRSYLERRREQDRKARGW